MIKVLIVDDEKMVRDGLVYTMPWKELGIEVVGAAANGKAALEIIREKKPQVVLTDIMMPEMNGLELLEIIKAEIPNIKVVILSGYDDFQYAQKALKSGVVDYLVKPVDADELTQLMERIGDSLQEDLTFDKDKLYFQKEIEDELEKYIVAIRAGKNQAALSTISGIFGKETIKNLPIEKYHKLSVDIVNTICLMLEKYGVELENTVNESYPGHYLELLNITSVQELSEWMQEFTKRIILLFDDNNGENYKMVISKAIDFIDNHYYEDLSVQRVAQNVYLNSNYFSHLFKKIRKESFTDYLNKVRIEKAKSLLTENIYKVYEVSDMVGYSDYKYFSSVFKKLVGVSPTEYNKLGK